MQSFAVVSVEFSLVRVKVEGNNTIIMRSKGNGMTGKSARTARSRSKPAQQHRPAPPVQGERDEIAIGG